MWNGARTMGVLLPHDEGRSLDGGYCEYGNSPELHQDCEHSSIWLNTSP
jgi:hypothetical protein